MSAAAGICAPWLIVSPATSNNPAVQAAIAALDALILLAQRRSVETTPAALSHK